MAVFFTPKIGIVVLYVHDIAPFALHFPTMPLIFNGYISAAYPTSYDENRKNV